MGPTDALFSGPTDITAAEGVNTLWHKAGVGDAITIGVNLAMVIKKLLLKQNQ